MRLVSHPDTSLPIRTGGMLARFCDVMVIAGGSLLATQAPRIADGSGYDSALIAVAMLLALMIFPSWGMYRVTRRHLFLRCVCVPALAWLFVLGVACVAIKALHSGYQPTTRWLKEWALISALGLVTCRVAAHAVFLRLTGNDVTMRAVAIVGHAAHCHRLMEKVEATPDSLYRVATLFDADSASCDSLPGLPTFRDREAFAAYVRSRQIEELWLALPLVEEATILAFVELFRNDLLNIRFIPDVSRLAVLDASMVNLEGTSAINLVASPISSHSLVEKEIFDRLFALCALVGLAPVLLVIALAVKFSSSGPVLFKQRRKGANGKVFDIYKFRSMREHAETDGVVKQATRGDPRVTRVGAFLRRTSLDELPQFINVLRGEMSVVGPRPHAIEHDKLYQDIVDGYIHRYRIKPGITGWAQVNGFRGETDRIEKMQGRVAHDLYYLSNWSFWLDMRIVLATIYKGFRHRNAY